MRFINFTKVKGSSFLLLALLFTMIFTSNLVYAVEYLKPPFEIKGVLADADAVEKRFDAQDMIFGKSYLQDAWETVTIKVYKDHFVGYWRYHNEKNSVITSVFTVSGTYDKGYLIGTWEITSTHKPKEGLTGLGPYIPTYEGSGTFYSSLIQHGQPVKANIRGHVSFTHSVFAPDSTPENVKWASETVDLELGVIEWNGNVVVKSCGDAENAGKSIDSGAIIQSIPWNGRVEVLRCGVDPDAAAKDAWIPATKDMKLYAEDHVRSGSNAWDISCVKFPDYNVYCLKPDTEIVVKEDTRVKQSHLDLLIGTIWENTKSMLKDGSFYIETSQAVAGRKGTEFFMSFDGVNTEVVVAEGLVTLTSKASGKSVDVGPNQRAVAGFEEVSAPMEYDAQKEAEQWEREQVMAIENQTETVEEDLTPREKPVEAPDTGTTLGNKSSEKSSGIMLWFVLMAVVGGLIGTYFFVRKRKVVQ